MGNFNFKNCKLPKDWHFGTIGEISTSFSNQRIPLKSADRKLRQGQYRYYGAQGVIDHIDDYIFDGKYLLVAEDGENVKSRKYDIAFVVNGKFWVNNHAHVLQANPLGDTDFLQYVLNFVSIKEHVTGQAQPKLNKAQLEKIVIPILSKPEQQKIAEVLSTVDKKIDLIDQKIAETEKLKTGLMQKLFSEGVGVQDSDGNWQPHSEFQDSPFGKIPKCWSVETLGEHTVKVGSGVTPKGGSKAYVDSGIPLIRSQNVLFGKFKLDDVAFITEQQHDKMKGSKLQPRDVLLNITGASIGRCAVLPEDFDEGNVNQHVCIIRTSESIDPDFCGWFLNSNLGQKQIWNLQAGGNREGLNFQQIRSFKIPVFSIEEQCSIVEILSTVSDKLNLLETQKAETQQLKKGLMQKLLTGEWRVPLDNPETA